jgi:hypothetical protein
MPYLTTRDIENNIPEEANTVCYRRISLCLIFIALGLFTITVFFSFPIKIKLIITGNVIFVIGIIILYFNRRRFPV